jgi:polysaccharide pyruvyl transferase WcaK-like protein
MKKSYLSRTAVLNRTHILDFYHPLSIYQNWPKGKIGRIEYFGWLSARNFGDDILAEVMRTEFSEFWVQSAHPRVRIEDRLLAALLGHQRKHASVIGGGTIIGGAFQAALLNSLRENVPMFSFASGVLPIERWHPEHINGWRHILVSATALTVRGYRSARVLKEFAQRTDIQVVGDFALATSEIYKGRLGSDKSKARPQVGINLGSHKYSSDDEHNSNLLNAFVPMMQKMSSVVNFVPVFLHDIDRVLTRKAFCRAGIKAAFEISLFEDSRSVTDLSGLDAMVSERLHGSILAHSYDVPSIGIGYDEKIFDHFEVIDQSDFHLEIPSVSAERLIRSLELVLGNRSELSRKIKLSRSHLREKQKEFVTQVKLEL